MFKLLITLLAFQFSPAHSAYQLAQNLNDSERQQLLRVVGAGSSGKILSSPYPLGGYQGVEVGLSVESIQVSSTNILGNQSNPQSALIYPKLTLGKGLYGNFDIFIHFIPYNETTGVTEYGALLRWGFYESTYWPFMFSTVFHGNNANFNSQLLNQNLGIDLTAGLSLGDLFLTVGYGKVSSNGTFIGNGPLAVTNSGQDEIEKISSDHYLISLVYHIQTYQIGLAWDKYEDSVISLKLGARL